MDYATLAPDLYDGNVADSGENAKRLRAALKKTRAEEFILNSLENHKAQPACFGKPLGWIWFSMGAYYALWLATQPKFPNAIAVLFYGTRSGDFAHSNQPFKDILLSRILMSHPPVYENLKRISCKLAMLLISIITKIPHTGFSKVIVPSIILQPQISPGVEQSSS